jgi:hypothetical protein
MAALTDREWLGWLSVFARKPKVTQDSLRARTFAMRVYKKSGGPTPGAKRLYAELLENEQRSRDEAA